ncbi:hypothetical protein [Kamptonema formosum]|uniref:hypothetical protein n=1 Tax=Kamptonema formosum TaxID=331992 RepID=UPI0012DDF2E7|nr:hypothetical protein [Oscillatoria sp. PCC 10802]
MNSYRQSLIKLNKGEEMMVRGVMVRGVMVRGVMVRGVIVRGVAVPAVQGETAFISVRIGE